MPDSDEGRGNANTARAAAEARKEFLFHVYDQMFNDINTHILVVWQSVGVVVASFAVFALAEKEIVSVDVGTALIVLLVVWLIGHLFDAAYWYNRNLVIIANIERQFLTREDLRNIHYYFGSHRKTGTMLLHLKIQLYLGLGIGALFLAVHLINRVLPALATPNATFAPERTLPYIMAGIGGYVLVRLRDDRDKSYRNILKNSPGISIDDSGSAYGKGHPVG
ncbi:MAG: hypothetical protein ACYC3S_10660 [Chloroflexota bacterium]